MMRKGVRISSMALAVMMAASLCTTGGLSMDAKASDGNEAIVTDALEEAPAGAAEAAAETAVSEPAAEVGDTSIPAAEVGDAGIPAAADEAGAKPSEPKTEGVQPSAPAADAVHTAETAAPDTENAVPAEKKESPADSMATGDTITSADGNKGEQAAIMEGQVTSSLTWTDIYNVTQVMSDVLLHYQANNDTTEEQIAEALRKAVNNPEIKISVQLSDKVPATTQAAGSVKVAAVIDTDLTGMVVATSANLNWPRLFTPAEQDTQNLADAKNIADDVIAALDGNVTNAIKSGEVMEKIEEALQSKGLGDAVTVTMEGWSKHESSADTTGTIFGTLHFRTAMNNDAWTAFSIKIPKDSTPEFDAVVDSLTQALKEAAFTNDTTLEDIMKVVQGVLPQGVSTEYSGIYVQKATEKANGYIGGTIILTSSRGVYEFKLENATKIPALSNADKDDVTRAKNIIMNYNPEPLSYSDTSEDDIIKMLQAQINSTGVTVSWNSGSIQTQPTEDNKYIILSGTLLLQKGDASEPLEYSLRLYNSSITKDYGFSQGFNSVWYMDSDSGLFFALKGDPSAYTELRVDGIILDRANYTVDSYGKAEFTLLPHYLQTLGLGKHTMEAYFSGGAVKTTFTIKPAVQNQPAVSEQKTTLEPAKKEEKEDARSPKTGDTANAGALFAAVLISGAGAAALYKKKRYE